jgi:dipeptidase
MGNDMLVALPGATTDRVTLFGHNCNRPVGESRALERVPGRTFAPGERVRTNHLSLPQARQTFTVIAGRFGGGWGYSHGINERGVAAGTTAVRTRLPNELPGLTGPDLVRIALERSATAMQAVDVVTDLVSRHGPGVGGPEQDEGDPILMLADGKEAYLLAACCTYWAVQEVREVRAQSDVCHLRQDWDRISPGLAGEAISRGWWPDDGSKLDFAGALVGDDEIGATGLRRWGRATMVLEQNNGQVDTPMVRRLLAELGDATRGGADASEPAASLVARLSGAPELGALSWWCCGVPGENVYLPLTVEGDLPAALTVDSSGGCDVWRMAWRMEELAARNPETRDAARSVFPSLQARFDRDAAEYLTEAASLRSRGELAGLHRLATSFMQHATERYEEACEGLRAAAHDHPHVAGSEVSTAVPS